MTFEEIRGIVWDLDNTLIASQDVFSDVLSEILAETEYTMPTAEVIAQHYHGSLSETIASVLRLTDTTEVQTLRAAFESRQLDYYAGDIHHHIYPDALSLALKAANKDMHQLLVTNREQSSTGHASPRAIVERTLLAQCIAEVHPGDEVSHRKPDSRALGDWAVRHNLLPSEIVVIGDQAVDAQLAFNVGAHAILVSRNGHIPHLEKLSDQGSSKLVVVPNLHDIHF